MSDVAQQPKPADPSQAPGQGGDHLTRLYAMSRTAGLTNQEYASVNPMAIVAVLAGIAGALAFFDLLLLAVPVVAVVCAFVSIRQINQSSGTQTGKGLAVAGLVIGLLTGGAAIGLELKNRASAAGDARAIEQSLADMGNYVKSGDYDKAYTLFDPLFQRVWNIGEFKRNWEGIQTAAGKLERFEWNRVQPREEGQAEGFRTLRAQLLVKFGKLYEDRVDVVFRQVDGKWLVIDFPLLFQMDKKRKAADNFNF